LTLVIELPIAAVWLYKEWKLALVISALLTLFTWPILELLIGYTNWSIPVMEIGVVIVEGIGYRLFFDRSWFNCMALSFMANAMSYGLAIVILD
jgi:hypothetical protein